jgi:hypothetical protein
MWKMSHVILTVALVVLAFAIVAASIAWAWRHGTLHPTEQERTDLEFERIVRRLGLPTR